MSEQRDLKRTGNPNASGWPDDQFSADLGHGNDLVDVGDATEETRPLGNHEAGAARERLGDATDRLTVLREGTRLQQGSTYVDLERLEDGPFVALAGQRVDDGQLIVSKRLIDYQTWNRLVGQDAERDVERPGRAS